MIELSLWGQVVAARYDQVLNILAGIAAMPPTPVLEKHYLFRPAQPPPRKQVQVGGTQGVTDPLKAARQAQASAESHYLRLVETVPSPLLGSEATSEDNAQTTNDEGEPQSVDTSAGNSLWHLYFYDVPEAGKRPVVVRSMTCVEIREGDPFAFMAGMGYA